jgi:DinB superfamily
VEIRTDKIGVLLDQLATSREISQVRLDGLTDEEYLWEPAPEVWSIRRREVATSSHAYGAGEWVLDFALPEPDPAPFTTIAWRLGHLYSGFSMRWEWTFGDREKLEDSVTFTPSASGMLDQLWTKIDEWQLSLETLTEEQADTVGFGQFPHGLDPELPFIGIIWWTNREFIHHMAEIGVLRDLWAARMMLK